MAVKLRLRRMGKKKQPIYKIVAADSRAPRDGKFLEAIGLYNPLTNPATIDIKEERALYWLGVGAQPTDTVKNLLSKSGILLKRELTKQGFSEQDVNSKFEAWSKLNEAKVGSNKKQTKSGANKEGVATDKEQPKEVNVAEVKSTTSDENPA
ncbi:MAG: 30S ribosomal protein S16 [Ignavibacteriales bacterium]